MQDIPTVEQPTPPQQPPLTPPPTYQPPQKPPPSQKRFWLIIGIVAAIMLVVGIFIGNIAGKGQTTTISPTIQAPQPDTTQPPITQPTQPSVTQPTQTNATIGKPVQVGDTWIVTVNSVKTNTGGEYSQPKSGYMFLVVDATLKNISSSTQNASSAMMFTLKDQTGQQYTETITGFAKEPPDGKVSPGSLLRGEMVYEVPSSMHTFTLTFEPSLVTNDMAEWKLTV